MFNFQKIQYLLLMNWIDSHCHLKSFYDKEELINVLSSAADVGLKKFINVGTSPSDWSVYRNLAEHHNNRLYYTVGIHPLYVDKIGLPVLTCLNHFGLYIKNHVL